MSQTCCNEQFTDEEYVAHLKTGLHGEIAALKKELLEMDAENMYLNAERDALRKALLGCVRYIRYGDGQSQDLSGTVVRSRTREPVDSKPTRGEALAEADLALLQREEHG